MKNHYEILGLRPSASKDEINTVYRKLSVKFHPDNNNGDPYFDKKFQQIKESYTILSGDSEKVGYIKDEPPAEVSLTISNKAADQSPEIIYFKSEEDSFEEGEFIKISWSTANADKVIIKPFGEVEKMGTKIFKPKNFSKKFLKLSLEATNSLSGKSLSNSFKIEKLVTEVNFSETEKEITVDKQLESTENSEPEKFVDQDGDEDSLETTEEPETFFSFDGRLRRGSYFFRAILLAAPAAIAYSIIDITDDNQAFLLSSIVLIIAGFLIWVQFVKRLHDINLSGWWSIINLIPIVGGLFSLVIIFIEGSHGENQYGPDPKET